jgi:hypothetical protein
MSIATFTSIEMSTFTGRPPTAPATGLATAAIGPAMAAAIGPAEAVIALAAADTAPAAAVIAAAAATVADR